MTEKDFINSERKAYHYDPDEDAPLSDNAIAVTVENAIHALKRAETRIRELVCQAAAPECVITGREIDLAKATEQMCVLSRAALLASLQELYARD